MTNNKDLTLNVDEFCLNIRVAVIAKTKKGYILEKRSNYSFLIGGRIKINESSSEAMIREIKEEIDIDIKEEDLEFKTVIENFFTHETQNIKIHEICFLYEVKKELENIILGEGLVECSLEEIKNLEIKPTILQKLLLEEKIPVHVIHKV